MIIMSHSNSNQPPRNSPQYIYPHASSASDDACGSSSGSGISKSKSTSQSSQYHSNAIASEPSGSSMPSPSPRRVNHTYRDYSRYRIEHIQHIDLNHNPQANALPSFVTSKRESSSFPANLHRILSNPEYAHIISWMPHGRAWKLHNKHAFLNEVVPSYFSQTKYESFTRQLTGWGFKKLHQSGPDFGAYYHECFLRGLPHLTVMMKRVEGNQGKTIPDAEGEPNFYDMAVKHPLPSLEMSTNEPQASAGEGAGLSVGGESGEHDGTYRSSGVPPPPPPIHFPRQYQSPPVIRHCSQPTSPMPKSPPHHPHGTGAPLAHDPNQDRSQLVQNPCSSVNAQTHYEYGYSHQHYPNLVDPYQPYPYAIPHQYQYPRPFPSAPTHHYPDHYTRERQDHYASSLASTSPASLPSSPSMPVRHSYNYQYYPHHQHPQLQPPAQIQIQPQAQAGYYSYGDLESTNQNYSFVHNPSCPPPLDNNDNPNPSWATTTPPSEYCPHEFRPAQNNNVYYDDAGLGATHAPANSITNNNNADVFRDDLTTGTISPLPPRANNDLNNDEYAQDIRDLVNSDFDNVVKFDSKQGQNGK